MNKRKGILTNVLILCGVFALLIFTQSCGTVSGFGQDIKDVLLKKYVPEIIETKQNLNCQVLTNPRIECTIETLNVVMPGLGLQEVKLKQCNR